MYSLFEHNKEFSDIVVHILDNGISEASKNQLSDMAEAFNRSIEYLDCSNIFAWLGKEVMQMFEHTQTNVPIASYARLFLPDLINSSVNNILYLDADSLVLGSFCELVEQDNSMCSVMGVLDNVSHSAKLKIGLDADDPYINAGMLWMNLKRMREQNFISRVHEFLKLYRGMVYHHDQGVINGLLHDEIGVVSPKYNAMSFIFERKTVKQICGLYNLKQYYSKHEFEVAKENPIFVHFTEGNVQRPWVESCKHPLKDKWLDYRNNTVWNTDSLLPDTRRLKYILIAWLYINCPVWLIKMVIGIGSKRI